LTKQCEIQNDKLYSAAKKTKFFKNVFRSAKIEGAGKSLICVTPLELITAAMTSVGCWWWWSTVGCTHHPPSG